MARAGRRQAGRAADPRRSAAWGRGRLAEAAALVLLLAKGYRILARRWRGPGAEIDIIARRGTTVVFIEVKARDRMADAELALTPGQRRRITRAAEFYLARHPRHAGGDRRYDVILVSKGAWPRHIEAAFDADA